MYVGLTWSSCLVYGDDIAIFGKTFTKQLVPIKYVPAGRSTAFTMCPNANFSEIKSFIISSYDIYTTQPLECTCLINQFICQPRMFTRASSYYCCSVKGFTDIACTLHNRVVNFNGRKIVLGLQYAAPYHPESDGFNQTLLTCWLQLHILSHLFCILHTCTNITRNKVICME